MTVEFKARVSSVESHDSSNIFKTPNPFLALNFHFYSAILHRTTILGEEWVINSNLEFQDPIQMLSF